MNKANPAMIGAFVIGAIALLVAGLLLVGHVRWFAERNTYIAYFPGSVKGLRVGAPVDFRGVEIGEVADIRVVFDPKAISARIPVVIQFDPARIDIIGMEPAGSYKEELERMIRAGFRAQLNAQSLLTGLLFVNLDFEPGTPVRLIGGDQPYPEIPTLPSGLEQLQESAGDIARQLPGVIDRANHLLGSVDDQFRSTSGDLTRIVADVAVLTGSLRESRPALTTILEDTRDATGKARAAAGRLDQTLASNQDAISSLLKEWTATAGAVRRMADQVNVAVAENRPGLRDFTQTGLYEFTGLAQDAQRMVDQIARVADEFERDPARFLFGERNQGVGP